MDRERDRRFVVTGTWGVGKTTVLDQLTDDFRVVPEPGRLVLAKDPSLEENRRRFVEALVACSLAEWEDASTTGIALFDRGLPDCLAYAHHFGLRTSNLGDLVAKNRYHPDVLMFSPWREIYTNDELRLAPFELAVTFHEVLVATYRDVGYDIVDVPQTTVEERVSFVRSFVGDRT